jgi:hypothetical protein
MSDEGKHQARETRGKQKVIRLCPDGSPSRRAASDLTLVLLDREAIRRLSTEQALNKASPLCTLAAVNATPTFTFAA